MTATRQERIAVLSRRQNLKNLDTALKAAVAQYGLTSVAQLLADHARETSDAINNINCESPEADKAGVIADLCEGLVSDLESADEV